MNVSRRQKQSPGSVAIIGAGIVGMSAAYFLARQGVDVAVYDSFAPAAGATGASDGAVSVASKKAGPLMELAIAGAEFYATLTRDGVLDDEFHPRSTFIVASTDEEERVLDRHADQLEHAGVRLDRLTGAAYAQTLGLIAPGARAAVEVHGDGHAIGYQVVERLRRHNLFPIYRNAAVSEFLWRDGAVVGLQTNTGPVFADHILVAAGLGAAQFLDDQTILRPRKGQLIVTERGDETVPHFRGSLMSSRYLVSKGSQPASGMPEARSFGLVIDPLRTGQFLIGGTREDDGDNLATDADAVRHLLQDAVKLSPSMARMRLLRVFAGIRAASCDGLPLVGRLQENVVIAAGFEGDGICLGPLMGKVCQQLICGEELSVDVSALDPARFGVGIRAA